jgi:tripartite ATP-independent transporter DctM subunit
MSLPELEKRGYDRAISLGSLAGSGTLGFMIPPSLIMIVYGVAAEVSLVRLYLAGFGPGILIMALYSGYIITMAILKPGIVPGQEQKFTWTERMEAGKELLPVLLLMVAVMGVLYLGVATATEAAAGGVIGALLVAAISRSLTWENFKASLMGTATLSCMICFILASASFLSSAMAYTGVPRAFAQWVVDMHLHPYTLMAALCVLYTILGCFIDSMSMIVLTLPVVLPLITSAGYDPVWFGIFMVVMAEIAQVTPPVGFNLFVLQGMTKRDIFEIARDSWAFCFLLIVAAAIITVFPAIALWLPAKSLGG